jgi:hypothetical protein
MLGNSLRFEQNVPRMSKDFQQINSLMQGQPALYKSRLCSNNVKLGYTVPETFYKVQWRFVIKFYMLW